MQHHRKVAQWLSLPLAAVVIVEARAGDALIPAPTSHGASIQLGEKRKGELASGARRLPEHRDREPLRSGSQQLLRDLSRRIDRIGMERHPLGTHQCPRAHQVTDRPSISVGDIHRRHAPLAQLIEDPLLIRVDRAHPTQPVPRRLQTVPSGRDRPLDIGERGQVDKAEA